MATQIVKYPTTPVTSEGEVFVDGSNLVILNGDYHPIVKLSTQLTGDALKALDEAREQIEAAVRLADSGALWSAAASVAESLTRSGTEVDAIERGNDMLGRALETSTYPEGFAYRCAVVVVSGSADLPDGEVYETTTKNFRWEFVEAADRVFVLATPTIKPEPVAS